MKTQGTNKQKFTLKDVKILVDKEIEKLTIEEVMEVNLFDYQTELTHKFIKELQTK